jgi:NAD(P)H-flavin reductase
MISDFSSKVIRNERLNDTVFETTIELDKPMGWAVGQYVSIQTPVPRSYSICSLPANYARISICVDTKPNGPGSNYIKNLRVGDMVNLKGPLGKFLLEIKPTNYIFVATGTGIGPLKAMIPTISDKKVKLFWGLRHESESYYQDFFEKLKSGNFSYQMVYSESGKHVTDFTKDLSGEFYACGNMAMIDDLKTQHSDVHYESYFGG